VEAVGCLDANLIPYAEMFVIWTRGTNG